MEKDEGAVLRDIGIAKAVAHADRVVNSWSTDALKIVVDYCNGLSSGDHVTSEKFRMHAVVGGLQNPPDNRAWGGVMRNAAKMGIITKIGWTTADDPKVHKNPVSLWAVV